MSQAPSHTILAVNDRTDQLEVLTSTIALAEYTVLKATNPTAAIRLALEQQPALIVIEISKHQTAQDLYRRIRSTKEIAETPILLVGAKENDHKDSATDSSKDDFLERPYEPITLAAKVARLVERKRTQDKLRRFFDLIDNADDVVYTHDLEGHYTSLNVKGQEITGYSSAEIAGLDFRTLATAEDVELAHSKLRSKLNGEAKNTIYELTIKAKDGTRIPFEVNTQLIYENGKPVGVQGIARDIRARKQAEEKLLQAERRGKTEYKILLERIAQLAQVLASARHLEQIFDALLEFTRISLPCNALGIALYDYEQGELTTHFLWLEGKKFDLSTTEPYSVANNSDILQAILSAKTIISKSSEQSILQSTKALNLSCSMLVPMTIMGRTIGLLEIQSVDTNAYQSEHTVAVQMAANLAANTIENVRLLTREREQETQLRQAQKMEAIGQLAGGVAHDFTNLITAIFGNCDSLLRGLEQSNPLRKHVYEIKQSGTRAATLTRQLLAFGRKQVLQPVNLNLNEVVTHITEQLITRLIAEDIKIICKLEDGLPQITADKTQLEQIIINLAVNARDAMPSGGTITIETSKVSSEKKQGKKQTQNESNPLVQLSISDTGIGMNSELRKHIFEPFFTTKPEGKGTGLGLPSVLGSVKQSGGSISVTSEEGQGTTFCIRFPISKDNSSFETPIDSELVPLEESHGGSETILIAEDDASVRQVLKNALSDAGYTILEAVNGLDALELFKQHNERIQLVITDVLMPQMNGRELALLTSSMRSVHVLYISGHPRDEITHRGVLLDGVNFLAKPFEGKDLLYTVRQILTEQEIVH